MAPTPKLTTTVACRVARIDRDRFNEHVAAGRYDCAPDTIPGRSRYFDPDDMIALWIFREQLDERMDASQAGKIACEVARVARLHPDARAISYVQDYFGTRGHAFPADAVPPHSDWDNTTFSGSDIRKVTTWRIGKLRELIAHGTEEERAKIGPED